MPSFLRAVPLAHYTTFGVGGTAHYFTEILDEDDLQRSVDFAHTKEIPLYTLGMGSNILISDEGFRVLAVHNNILGYEQSIGEKCVRISAGAGEIWDGIVERCASSGWSWPVSA